MEDCVKDRNNPAKCAFYTLKTTPPIIKDIQFLRLTLDNCLQASGQQLSNISIITTKVQKVTTSLLNTAPFFSQNLHISLLFSIPILSKITIHSMQYARYTTTSNMDRYWGEWRSPQNIIKLSRIFFYSLLYFTNRSTVSSIYSINLIHRKKYI